MKLIIKNKYKSVKHLAAILWIYIGVCLIFILAIAGVVLFILAINLIFERVSSDSSWYADPGNWVLSFGALVSLYMLHVFYLAVYFLWEFRNTRILNFLDEVRISNDCIHITLLYGLLSRPRKSSFSLVDVNIEIKPYYGKPALLIKHKSKEFLWQTESKFRKKHFKEIKKCFEEARAALHQ